MFAFIFSYKLVGGKLIFQKYLTNMPRIKKQSSGKLTKACFLIKYSFNIPSKKVFFFVQQIKTIYFNVVSRVLLLSQYSDYFINSFLLKLLYRFFDFYNSFYSFFLTFTLKFGQFCLRFFMQNVNSFFILVCFSFFLQLSFSSFYCICFEIFYKSLEILHKLNFVHNHNIS